MEINEQVLDLYKSLRLDKKEDDNIITLLAIDHGLSPVSIRYGVMGDVRRGIIKSDNELFYFTYVPEKSFKVVKADTPQKEWEANRIIKNSVLGCDLLKSEEKHEDKEDEKKAVVANVPAANTVVPEQDNVAQQNQLATDAHPGSATESTPDTAPERWHPEEAQKSGFWSHTELLKGLGQQLKATAPVNRIPGDKEQEFMVTVLGKNPSDVAAGRETMGSSQRMMFNRWLQKSLDSRLNTLRKWVDKNS